LISDIDGDALHSSVGLPAALNVASAKVGKLEITVEFELLFVCYAVNYLFDVLLIDCDFCFCVASVGE
jgi:hypothetical protein